MSDIVKVLDGGPATTAIFQGVGTSGLVPDPETGSGTRVLQEDGTWVEQSGGGGGGAPTTAQYLVTALSSGLSAERVLAGEAGVLTLDTATPGAATVGVATSGIANVKLANQAQATIKGRASGAGTGVPTDLTPTQVRTIINVEDGATADQIASEVPFTPAGTLSATDVQSALAELDTEKAAASHTQAISTIIDLQAALDAKLVSPVANADLATMAQSSIKGRAAAAGTGVPVNLTADEVRTLIEVEQGAIAGPFIEVDIGDDQITNIKLRDSDACSVIGRSANSVGDPDDIDASSNGQVLGRLANVLGFNDFASYATTAPGSGVVPKTQTDNRLPRGFMRPFPQDLRYHAWQHDVGATTFSLIGTPIVLDQVGTGTPSAVDTTRPYEQQLTGIVTGDAAGRIGASGISTRAYNPEWTFLFATGTSIANLRIWVGLTTADLNAVSSPTTESVAAIRFDTGAGDAGVWSIVTCDGAGTPTVQASSGAIAGATRYRLRIVFEDTAGIISFYLNDVLIGTATSAAVQHLPGATTQLKPIICVTGLAVLQKRIFIDSISCLQE